MNSRDRNIFTRNPSLDHRIITGFDDAQIFVGSANEQASKLQIGSALQRCGRFRINIDKHRRELQLAFRIGQRGLRPEVAAHHLGQFQPRFGRSAMRFLDLRIEFASLHGRAGQGAAINQPSFVTLFLTNDILFQSSPLVLADRLQRAVVERRIKSQPGRVQLFHHGHI